MFISFFLQFFIIVSYQTDSKRICHEGDVNKLAICFTFRRQFDVFYTGCPKETWLDAQSKVDIQNVKTNGLFINVGFNKGYNFASWLNLFFPWTNVDPKIWHDVMKKTYEFASDKFNCGYCDECDEHKLFKYNGSIPSTDVMFIGLDINKQNLNSVNSIWSSLSNYSDVNLQGISLNLLHAAGGKSEGTVHISPCKPGDEGCHVSFGNSKGAKELIRMISIEQLVYEIYLNYSSTHQFKVKNIKSHKHPLALNTQHSDLLHNQTSYNVPIIDILKIDTEGSDALVIEGARRLLKYQLVRCIIFEYSNLSPWIDMKLYDIVKYLDEHGYGCYLEGHGELWSISGECWHYMYEFHAWSNVVCFDRKDEWFDAIQPYVVNSKFPRRIFI